MTFLPFWGALLTIVKNDLTIAWQIHIGPETYCPKYI